VEGNATLPDGRAAFAWSLATGGGEAPLAGDPAWVGYLQSLDPCRVMMAMTLPLSSGEGMNARFQP
jgi:hypothetical protein